MKLSRKIIIFAGAVMLAACGASRKMVTPPAVVVDSRPATADTIADSRELVSDTVAIDTVYADTINADSIPFIKATSSWKRDIREGIDDILESSLLKTSVCGLEVWDLDDDISLYRHDEMQRMRPASTLKTITAITALEELLRPTTTSQHGCAMTVLTRQRACLAWQPLCRRRHGSKAVFRRHIAYGRRH